MTESWRKSRIIERNIIREHQNRIQNVARQRISGTVSLWRHLGAHFQPTFRGRKIPYHLSWLDTSAIINLLVASRRDAGIGGKTDDCVPRK